MKLFVLLSRFPYPLEKGDKLRAYHQIKELSKRNEVHLCCLTDTTVKAEWMEEMNKYCETITVHKLSRLLIWWNTAKQLFSDKPFQIGYFYQSGINRKIQQQLNQLHPDHIYCQLIRTAEYVKNKHDIPKTIDFQDALSKGMLRRAEIATGIKKSMFTSEGRRLSAYENRIFDYFNGHTIISQQDKALINHPSKDQIAVIENGISTDFFNYPHPEEKVHTLIFVGNMNYPPNVECSTFIVNEILPHLNAGSTLGLMGASPHQKVVSLGKHPQVRVTGWINDIRDAYASGKIFVAPLFIGTGLQNKLLEAMAMGVPVITTTLANNALHAKDGEQLLIANTAEEFIAQINTLLTDEALYKKVSEQAKEFVKLNYSWEESVSKLEVLFKGQNS